MATINPQGHDMSSLELELSRVENSIRDLNLHRSSILQQLNARRSIFNQLPSEILAEVFLATVERELWDDTPLGADEGTQGVSPLLLGSICRRWRDIAWAIPQLWCRISLVLSRKHYSSQVVVLAEWLSRTSLYPLSINITPEKDGAGSWVQNPPVEIISLVVPLSHRWRHFGFFPFATCHTQLAAIYHRLPILESLAFSSQSLTSYLHSPKVWTLFTDVPKLHRLLLNREIFTYVQLPFAQLTHVTVNEMTVDECIDILRECHNAECCSFMNTQEIEEDEADNHLPAEPLVMSKLRSLLIDLSEDVIGYSYFFDNFDFPGVREVTAGAHAQDSRDEERYLFGSITNFIFSRCHVDLLRFISIQVHDFDDHILIELLNYTANLQELKLIKTSDSQRRGGANVFNRKILSALSQLHPSGNRLHYAPELRSLYYSGPVGFTVEDLLTCLEVRRGYGYLNQFTIPKAVYWGTQNDKTSALCERFEVLVKRGMSLDIVLGGVKWV